MSESEAIREIRNLREISNYIPLYVPRYVAGCDTKQLLKQTANRLIYYVWSSEKSEVLEIMKDWHVN